MRVGAIDIGTNSLRLLVAEVQSDSGSPPILTAVARAGQPCRLGKRLDETGAIQPKMVDRALRMTAEFVKRIQSLGVAHTVIGATAALRSASNGQEVAALIESHVGIPVRILSEDEEASLVYRSVVQGLGRVAASSSCVVFDLGGGSTEIVSGVGDRVGRWTSLPQGAVTLTERYLRSDPASQGELDDLRREVSALIMHHCAMFPASAPLLAGVGGTVTVLALMDRDLQRYEPAMIQSWVILRPRLEALVERIGRTTQAERRAWPAMGEGRADIVVAGAIAVSLLVERFGAHGLVCSTQGLRYGLARVAAEEFLARVPPAPPQAAGQ